MSIDTFKLLEPRIFLGLKALQSPLEIELKRHNVQKIEKRRQAIDNETFRMFSFNKKCNLQLTKFNNCLLLKTNAGTLRCSKMNSKNQEQHFKAKSSSEGSINRFFSVEK